MRKLDVSDNQLMHLFDMCVDAESRCEQRAREARERGEHERAAREAGLCEKYRYLKQRLFEAMKDGKNTSTLDQIARTLKSLGEARAPASHPDISSTDRT